jgi:nucleotide-binding universal stress UspA family protein
MEFRTVLHPTDLSDLSQTALGYAAEMAHDHGGKLLILHAVDTLGPENLTYSEAISQPQPETYRRRLWEEIHRARPSRSDVAVEYLLSDQDPVEAILTVAAERRCDLIVMASHGRTGLKRFFMGSGIAEEVVRRAPCPVLVVKARPAGTPSRPDAGDELHPHVLTEKQP